MLDIELGSSCFPFHTSTSLAESHLPSLARSLWNLDSGITKSKKKGEGEVRSITLLEGIWGVGQEVSPLTNLDLLGEGCVLYLLVGVCAMEIHSKFASGWALHLHR